jgi:succinyl-diaminopimelate desuccinylase
MDLLSETAALMEISSVTGDEEALARFLFERLSRAGRPATMEGRSVLVAPPDDDRPLVVLAGHLDTVPPQGNEQPRRDGEILWGRGSVDMKGGLAVIVALMEHPAVESGWARVGAILYAGEEGPLAENDLARLLDGPAGWALRADLAIVCEPTGAEIEVGCVGTVNVEAIFRGEACHSARPWLGRSAISRALPWLERISRFEPREHTVHGFSFRETATVTTLHAGVARNVVPGELVANLNYRFPPGWDLDRGTTAALALAVEADAARVIDAAPSGAIPLDRPLFAAFVKGSGAVSRAKQAWTDVAQMSARGVPALNFGPGDPQFAHRQDERTTLESLVRCRTILAAFLEGNAPFGNRGIG